MDETEHCQNLTSGRRVSMMCDEKRAVNVKLNPQRSPGLIVFTDLLILQSLRGEAELVAAHATLCTDPESHSKV